MTLNWGEREIAVARLALSQLSFATDTGAERGLVADMLADLTRALDEIRNPAGALQ